MEVSIAGAAGPWTTVKSHSTTQGASAAFVSDSVVLDSFVGNADVRIRFRYTAGWDWWWAIDDVVLSTCAVTPTPTPTPTPSSAYQALSSTARIRVLGPVPDVTLTLTGTTGGSTLSDGSGNYTFSSLPSGGSYTVTPSKAALAPGSAGINTVDVIAAQRHFLNLGTPPARMPADGC